MTAYYNEIDPQKAAWLRELIRQGVIAAGDVDERSIKDVNADELAGYAQCHLFAGIGIWSYALRLAGWPDDKPAWTGSCPCPSFSAAGKGQGFDDPRHLWPDWFRLIRQCKPSTVIGEQASAAIGYGWLDLVQTDLEAEAYAVGKAVLGACSVGAPHMRQRCYFVADAGYTQSHGRHEDAQSGLRSACNESAPYEPTGKLGHAESIGRREGWTESERQQGRQAASGASIVSTLAYANSERGCSGQAGSEDAPHARIAGQTGPTNGFWSDAEWIPCRSLKVPGAIEWRAIEPGTFALAAGATNRVLKLRGYGDGIVAPLAAEFITAYLEATQEQSA